VLGAAVGVRAGVDQDRRSAAGGDWHGDRRAANAGHAPQQDEAGREHRTGASGGNDCVGLPVRDGLDRPHERAVLLGAKRVCRLLVHAHDLRRGDERKPTRVEALRAEDDRLDAVGRRLLRPLDDGTRATVAAHRIDGHAHGLSPGSAA